MSSVSTLTHVQRVRILYKTCLRLHRGMPTQMQIIGDAYVKDEFKRFVKDFSVLLDSLFHLYFISSGTKRPTLNRLWLSWELGR